MARVTSVSSLGWAHYTLYEALPRMAKLGFQRGEIASFDEYCFHFNFGSPTPGELRDMVADFGLHLVCLNYSHAPQQAWVPENVDLWVEHRLRKLAHLAEAGIPLMSMLFGRRNDRPDIEEQLARSVQAYDRVGDAAAKYGVRAVMELPHLYNIANRPEQVLWILDRLSSDNVGVLMDSSHWGIIGYDMDEYLGRLGDRLWHVHLRDSAGDDTGDFKQDLELTPGKGTVDFRKLSMALDRAGYKGDVSLEFEYRDMTFDDIDREYASGLKHLSDCGWDLPEAVKARL